MPKIYSHSVRLDSAPASSNDIVDAFCVLQKGFTDQFVYYDKERKNRYMGLGRCIAIPSLDSADFVLQGAESAPHPAETAQSTAQAAQLTAQQSALCPAPCQPILFSFNRFDEANPKPADDMMSSFPKVRLMVPEVVLIENESGTFLQVNSLGPVYPGRIERFARHIREAKPRTHRTMPYTLTRDSFEDWQHVMEIGLATWYECDVNYMGGFRGAERLLYSDDGLIYYTGDHYASFTLVYGWCRNRIFPSRIVQVCL